MGNTTIWLFIHHCVSRPLLFALHAAESFHDWTGRKAYPKVDPRTPADEAPR